MTQLTTLLDRTEALFRTMHLSKVEAAAALYEVYQKEAWRERHESWNQYLPTLGISQSEATKAITIIEHYREHGGLSLANIAEVKDFEKLYLAKNLEGTPEEQVEKALVLSRSDLRAQKSFEETGQEHQHEPICRICHMKLS